MEKAKDIPVGSRAMLAFALGTEVDVLAERCGHSIRAYPGTFEIEVRIPDGGVQSLPGHFPGFEILDVHPLV